MRCRSSGCHPTRVGPRNQAAGPPAPGAAAAPSRAHPPARRAPRSPARAACAAWSRSWAAAGARPGHCSWTVAGMLVNPKNSMNLKALEVHFKSPGGWIDGLHLLTPLTAAEQVSFAQAHLAVKPSLCSACEWLCVRCSRISSGQSRASRSATRLGVAESLESGPSYTTPTR